jgi:tetratricopeptide (TPR) repeat protein
LRRFFIPAALWLLVAGCVGAAEHGQLDASPGLFTVLAAVNAAGYDAELASPNNHPLRAQVRHALTASKSPVLKELQSFFAAHRQANATAELSQYISLALSTSGPPDFNLRFKSTQIPPDVQPLQDLLPLLQTFYVEAHIDELWRQAQPGFEEAIARYQQPLSLAILQVNSYLRNPTSGYLGRRFQVYLDLLGAPNQVQTRSYADDYIVVVTASAEPRVDDVRHAYLHYLLDPLATKYGMELLKKRALLDLAQPAPALDAAYKSDFLLLSTESLIKAIETRLPGSKTRVEEALREGYILTPFFAEQLLGFEKEPDAMRLAFPEMVKRLNSAAEIKRLAGVEFSAKARERAAKVAERPAEPAVRVNPTLEEAERLYKNRDLEGAKQAYLRLLKESDDQPLHARAYYGLARVAVLQKDPETGDRLFQKVLECSPEPDVKAWALVYLGRLSDIAGDRSQAELHYQNALAVIGDSAAAARGAAEKGMREIASKHPN